MRIQYADQLYVGRDNKTSIVITEKAPLSVIDRREYSIGTSPQVYDNGWSQILHRYLVMTGSAGKWLIT